MAGKKRIEKNTLAIEKGVQQPFSIELGRPPKTEADYDREIFLQDGEEPLQNEVKQNNKEQPQVQQSPEKPNDIVDLKPTYKELRDQGKGVLQSLFEANTPTYTDEEQLKHRNAMGAFFGAGNFNEYEPVSPQQTA